MLLASGVGRTKTIADEELLRIAREVFREHGHTATTRDIAEAAGVSQAVLYQRFGSKEELFLRAMTPEVADLDVLLGPYPPRSAKADLSRIVERLAAFFRSHLPTLLPVLAHPELSGRELRAWHAHLPFGPIHHALARRISRMHADGLIAKCSPDSMAWLLMSTGHTIAFLETAVDVRHVAKVDQLVEALWTGLAPG